MAIEDRIISELAAILQNGGDSNNLHKFFQDKYYHCIDKEVLINYDKLNRLAEKETTVIRYMLAPYIEEVKRKEEYEKTVAPSLWDRVVTYIWFSLFPNPIKYKT